MKTIDQLIINGTSRDLLDREATVGFLMIKANVGFSVVPVTRDEYFQKFFTKQHANGKTVKKALVNFNKGEIV